MNKLTPLVVVLLVGVASLAPVAAQGYALTLKPLKFGPENSTFYFLGSEKDDTAAGSAKFNACSSTLDKAWGGNGSATESKPYAINNENDLCAVGKEVNPESGEEKFRTGADRKIIEVPFYPKFKAGTPLEEGTAMSGSVTLLIGGVTNGEIVAAFVRPKISLVLDGTEIGSWDEAPAFGPDQIITGQGSTDDPYVATEPFAFDLGGAPAELGSGVLKLVIDLNDEDTTPEGLRCVTLGAGACANVGIGITEAHRGSVVIPFAAGAHELYPEFFAPPKADEPEEENNTTGDENGPEILPEGNETGNETGNDTMDPGDHMGNNTTDDGADTDDEGLPGFETVAVLSAALAAVAVAARARRHRPGT